MTPSQLASRLGRLARGKPKNYSPAEIKRRTALLKKASKLRWAKKAKKRSTRR